MVVAVQRYYPAAVFIPTAWCICRGSSCTRLLLGAGPERGKQPRAFTHRLFPHGALSDFSSCWEPFFPDLPRPSPSAVSNVSRGVPSKCRRCKLYEGVVSMSRHIASHTSRESDESVVDRQPDVSTNGPSQTDLEVAAQLVGHAQGRRIDLQDRTRGQIEGVGESGAHGSTTIDSDDVMDGVSFHQPQSDRGSPMTVERGQEEPETQAVGVPMAGQICR